MGGLTNNNKGLSGTEPTGENLTAAGFGSFVNGLTEKTTPVDADMVPLMDSAASNATKKLSWANIKATLVAYFTANSFTATNFISTGAANTVKEYSANSGSAITIDPANGETQYITLNAATPVITFASAPAAGTSKRIKLTLIQDGTGGRLPTFANCTFLATGSSTATAINSAISSLTYFEAEAINGAWVIASANQNLGITDGSSAASGYIGEVISSTVAIGSAVSLTTATAKTITSITLSPGDWMVSGNIGFIAAAGTLPTLLTASISSTNNTQATSPNGGAFNQLGLAFTAASTNVLPLAPTRINITTQTTYYLVGTATFTVSTLTAYGSITARRFR